jgi:hypothetical protein
MVLSRGSETGVRLRSGRSFGLAPLVVVVGVAIALSACGSSSGQASDPPHHAPSKHAPESTLGTTSSTEPTTSTLPTNSSWATSGTGLEPAITPHAAPDQSLNSLLANQFGPGWVGGDSTYSTKLPDGRIAFVFSDTLIGTAQADGTASVTGMAHSSELVGALPNLVPDYSGNFHAPQSLIPDTSNSSGIWETGATYTEGADQMIFVNEYTGPSGILTLSYTGQSGIADMSVPSNGLPTTKSVTLLPKDPDTTWGSALVSTGGYLYVYGADLDRANHSVYGMKVGRVPLGQSTDVGAWTYWDGSQWVADESQAVVVQTLNNLTGVVANPNGKGFIGVSIPSGLLHDTTVDLAYANSPVGPWTAPEPIYVIPEIRQYSGEMAYFPTFHQELASSDQLVVSYNLDTTAGYPVLLHDVHSYQPVFLTITG